MVSVVIGGLGVALLMVRRRRKAAAKAA